MIVSLGNTTAAVGHELQEVTFFDAAVTIYQTYLMLLIG